MFRKWMVGAAVVLGGLLATTWLWADTPSAELTAAVDKSMKAMDATNVHTLVIAGDGGNGSVGQPCNPHDDWWRHYANKDYVRSVDLDKKSWRVQFVRKEGDPKSCGGAGTTNPAPDQVTNTVTPAIGPTTAWNTQLDYIFLPEGFLKTALEKNATVSSETMKGKKYTVLTFMGDNKQPVKGYIDEMGYVDRVETMIAGQDPIGDAIYFVEFDGYKQYNGVKFPSHILERQGPIKNPPKIFELNVVDVRANEPIDLTPPAGRGGRGGFGGGAAAARGGPGGRGTWRRRTWWRQRRAAEDAVAAVVADDDLGGGAWLITGGYGSVVVNFKDYIVVIEGPQNEARAEADYRRSQEAGSRQAHQVRDQYPRSLRPLRRIAGFRGRGRHHRHQHGQQGLLRDAVQQPPHHPARQTLDDESAAQDSSGVRGRIQEDDLARRRQRDRPLSRARQHA